MNRRERDAFDDLPILGELRDALAAHMSQSAAAAGPAPRGHERRQARTLGVSRRAACRARARGSGGPGGRGRRARRCAPSDGFTVAATRQRVTAARVHPRARAPGGRRWHRRAQRQTIAHDHACAQTANRGQTIDHGCAARIDAVGPRRAPAPGAGARSDQQGAPQHRLGCRSRRLRQLHPPGTHRVWPQLLDRPRGAHDPFGPIPARCYGEFRATLKRDLRHASAAARARALEAQQQQLDAERQESEHRQGLCFIEIGLHTRPHPGAVGFGCSGCPHRGQPALGRQRVR